MTILRPYHFPDLLPQYFDNLSMQIYSVFDILDSSVSFIFLRCLNELVWLLYLVLNSPAAVP